MSRRCFGIATLLWGTAYLLAALEDRTSASRFLNLNVFGSVSPPAALLEWLAIAGFAIAIAAWMAPRIPTRWQNAGLLAMTLLAVAVIGEGAARIAAVVSPTVMGFPTYSQTIWHHRHTTTNSLGFRDIEHNLSRAADISRAIVIGDSFTYGTGIENVKDRFSEQLADGLNERGTEKWEVMNAGREDTHTLQHLAVLPQLLDFKPDLVILLYVFNDMDYLAPQTARSSILGNGSLVTKLNPSRVLFLNSYFYQEVLVRWRKVVFTFRDAAPDATYANDTRLRQHLADLDRLVRTVVDSGASALIVPFDYSAGLDARRGARYRNFVQEARQFGLPVCDIKDAFAGQSFELLRVNALDAHPNRLANQLAVNGTLDCLAEPLTSRDEGPPPPRDDFSDSRADNSQ